MWHACAAKMAFMVGMYCSVASGEPRSTSMRGRGPFLLPAGARLCALLTRQSARDSAPDSTAGLGGPPAQWCT